MIDNLRYKNIYTGIEVKIDNYDTSKSSGDITIIFPYKNTKLNTRLEPDFDNDFIYSDSEVLKLVDCFTDSCWNEARQKIFIACFCNRYDILEVAKTLLSEKASILDLYKYFCTEEETWEDLAESIIDDFYPELAGSINEEQFIEKLKHGDTVYINDHGLFKKRGHYWEYDGYIYGHTEE